MPRVETLLMANHAEAQNGLLYVMGGGWTDLHRPPRNPEDPPPVSHIGIGVTILVAWTETNRRYPLLLKIESEDGRELFKVEGEMESGRPPGSPEGQDLRSALAVNGEVAFPHPGGYRVVAQVGDDVRTVSFRVQDQAAVGGTQPS